MIHHLKAPWYITLCLTILVSGCLSRPTLDQQYFSFPAPSVSTLSITSGPVVEIRKVTVSAPFENQPFIYRTGEFTYERDAYAEFLVPPAESLIGPLRAYLESIGAFRTVTVPGSAFNPDRLVDITVDELYGDFRARGQPAAVLLMDLTFSDASNGLGGKLLFQRHFAERVPLKARTAAGLMAGWNEALQRIIKTVQSDVRSMGTKEGANRLAP